MIIYFFKIHINVINDCNFINTIEIAALKLKLYQSSINTRQPSPAEHSRGVRAPFIIYHYFFLFSVINMSTAHITDTTVAM